MIGAFKQVKRTTTKKKKLMLWVDNSLIEEIESLKPRGITTQEAIRQILAYYVEETKALNGL